MISLIEAIKKINPNAKITVRNNDINSIKEVKDILFINTKELPWYLLYFGSSRDFSKKIRLYASKKGYKLNEKHNFKTKNPPITVEG